MTRTHVPPKIEIDTAWRPKEGHSEDEYEDAFAVSEPQLPLRAAVADGATESAFSGRWARALAGAFVERGELSAAVDTARANWAPQPDPARWYAAAKAAEGAHAAILGLTIDRERWRAESVGDCCLFHIRGARILETWPMTSADAFSHHPPLISSRPSDAIHPESDVSIHPDSSPSDHPSDHPTDHTAIESTNGTWKAGDDFILASDAIAQWLLGRIDQSDFRLGAGASAGDLDALIAEARSNGMRNDDVTLIAISIRF